MTFTVRWCLDFPRAMKAGDSAFHLGRWLMLFVTPGGVTLHEVEIRMLIAMLANCWRRLGSDTSRPVQAAFKLHMLLVLSGLRAFAKRWQHDKDDRGPGEGTPRHEGNICGYGHFMVMNAMSGSLGPQDDIVADVTKVSTAALEKKAGTRMGEW